MKFNNAFLFVICLVLFGCDSSSVKNVSDTLDKQKIKLMTYNIRLNTATDGENAWPHRKSFLSSQVLFLGPDILGVQEALPDQVVDLNKALVDYKHIGIGRDGGDNGEYSAIYYNSKSIKLEEHNTFWLSKTPDTISKGWDAALPRICTYGLFSKSESKDKFWVFNTHFDHVGAEARKESLKLIVEKITELNKSNHPVVVMGDFNSEPSGDIFEASKSILNDVKDIAKLDFGPNGTFNGFRYDEPVTRRIDYILVSKSPKIEVQKYAVLSSAIYSKFPSDHFPVYVEVDF